MKTWVAALIFFAGLNQSLANVEMSLTRPDEAQKKGEPLPGISFLNEDDKMVDLITSSPGKAFLLLPFYAHCSLSCPLNVAYLKEVLKKTTDKDYKVVLFSFNPHDTGKDLKEFRQALQVPEDWELTRASQADTLRLLETLDFRYMTQGADFVHSNTIVVLSPGLRIIKFIQGLGYSAKNIDDALVEARKTTKSLAFVIRLISLVIFGSIVGGLIFRNKKGAVNTAPF